MKFTSQEEYGLRCLLRIVGSESEKGLTISEISEAEGLSQANTAKLLRILRLGNIIESVRGQSGGYRLARPADEITVTEALEVLGGKLFDTSFCESHTGNELVCSNNIDCSIRSLLRIIQNVIDSFLSRTTLSDLAGSEIDIREHIKNLTEKLVNKSSTVIH